MLSGLLMIAGLTLPGAAGCGSDSFLPAKSAVAPPAVTALVFYVPTKGDDVITRNVGQALQAMLIKTGCKVVTTETEQQDAVADYDVVLTQSRRLVNIQLGSGKAAPDYQADVTIKIMAGARMVDRLTSSFVAYEGQVTAKNMSDLLQAFTASPAISAFGAELQKQKTDVEAGKKAQVEAAAREAQDKEEATWRAANVEGCRNPTTSGACVAVWQYIKTYPSGVHVAEGRQAWQVAESKIRELAEQEAWSRVSLPACKGPTEATSCDAGKSYIDRFPNGPHAAEARAAVEAFTKKWQAIE